MTDTVYVLNRAVQARSRQRRDTNRRQIEYLMLAFPQFHFLFSYHKNSNRSGKLILSQVSAQLSEDTCCWDHTSAWLPGPLMVFWSQITHYLIVSCSGNCGNLNDWNRNFSSNTLKSLLKQWYLWIFYCGIHRLLTGDTLRNKRTGKLLLKTIRCQHFQVLSQRRFVR